MESFSSVYSPKISDIFNFTNSLIISMLLATQPANYFLRNHQISLDEFLKREDISPVMMINIIKKSIANRRLNPIFPKLLCHHNREKEAVHNYYFFHFYVNQGKNVIFMASLHQDSLIKSKGCFPLYSHIHYILQGES